MGRLAGASGQMQPSQTSDAGALDYTNVAWPTDNPFFSITIEHLPTSEDITFDGWVTQFQDSFNSTWKGTPVYGRMDDLYTFQRTGRKISMAFDVVAADNSEAQLNQHKLNRLAQFLYPVYSAEEDPNKKVLVAAPLLRMAWAGLVQDASTGAGLVGFLNGFTYAPDIDAGPMVTTNARSGGSAGMPVILYQKHTVNLEYTVLHTHLPGWVQKSTAASEGGTTYAFGSKNDDLSAYYPHAGARGGDILDPILTAIAPFEKSPLLIAGEEKILEEMTARERQILEGRHGEGNVSSGDVTNLRHDLGREMLRQPVPDRS